jgi:hypothetical protein
MSLANLNLLYVPLTAYPEAALVIIYTLAYRSDTRACNWMSLMLYQPILWPANRLDQHVWYLSHSLYIEFLKRLQDVDPIGPPRVFGVSLITQTDVTSRDHCFADHSSCYRHSSSNTFLKTVLCASDHNSLDAFSSWFCWHFASTGFA